MKVNDCRDVVFNVVAYL